MANMEVQFRDSYEVVKDKVEELTEGEKFATREMAGWIAKSSGRVAIALKRLEDRNCVEKEWEKNIRIWKVIEGENNR